jgi:hypothetical protein
MVVHNHYFCTKIDKSCIKKNTMTVRCISNLLPKNYFQSDILYVMMKNNLGILYNSYRRQPLSYNATF